MLLHHAHQGAAEDHHDCAVLQQLVQLMDTVLSKNGFLYEEPYFLLKSESMAAVNYFSIIKAIADGSHKLGKLAGVSLGVKPLLLNTP